MFCAIAHTGEFGDIPGKVVLSDPGVCYYAYFGKEKICKNFTIYRSHKLSGKPSGVPPVFEKGVITEKKGLFRKKEKPYALGFWPAVVDYQGQKICGKADKAGNCYFAFKGAEISQNNNF